MGGGTQLVEDLVVQFPMLEDSYSSHVFNEGGVLPHVFFWDVVQEVIDSFLSHAPNSLDWRSVLSFLEDRISRGDSEVNEVICTSFLWYMPNPGEAGYDLVAQMGPAMARKFLEIRPRG